MNHETDDDSTQEDENDRVAKRPRREWSPGPQIPPAPPSTPATLIEARTPHGHIPVIPFIQNADVLERDQLVNGELATPAPTKTAASKPKMDDFYHWVVGSRYELIRMLGRGSYGQVAQAKDLWDNNKLVAIKRIASAFEQEIDAVRLYRETHILRRLRGHDCIITLLNVIEPPSFEDFTDLYLVFDCEYTIKELHEGISLLILKSIRNANAGLYSQRVLSHLIHSISMATHNYSGSISH
jgi:Protein kinase domain